MAQLRTFSKRRGLLGKSSLLDFHITEMNLQTTLLSVNCNEKPLQPFLSLTIFCLCPVNLYFQVCEFVYE
jgi:hypothetical protein